MKRLLLSPPACLLAANIGCAALGLLQSLIVVRELGASAYGIVGIIVTMGGVVANFWDVRLNDLVSKLYYAGHDDKTATIRLFLCLNAALAVLMAVSIFLLTEPVLPLFTEATAEPFWIIAQGSVIGLSFLTGSAQTALRLTGSFYAFALSRLAAQLVLLIVMVGSITHNPTVSGYYDGLLTGSICAASLALLTLGGIWHRHINRNLWHGRMLEAWPAFRGEFGFILSGNLMAYSKMLSRSGDVLVFGYFAGDATTGVYRLARNLADNLGIITDALSQYFQPTFFCLMAGKDHAALHRLRRRFVIGAAVLVAISLPPAWAALDLLNRWFLHGDFSGLELTTCLLLTNYFWIAGIHMWLWPAVVHDKLAHYFAFWSTAGSLAQLALIVLGCTLIKPSPALAAGASLAYYAICYLPVLRHWHRRPEAA